MDGFVDIHTHILPGVDDGAKSVDEALEIINFSYKEGVRQIVLTPHYRGNFKNYYDELKPKYDNFIEKVNKIHPDLKIFLGCEIHYDSNVSKLLIEKELATINNSSYCLIELGLHFNKTNVLNAISDIVYSGFIPIIAHIEEYDVFRQNKSLVDEIINMGALIQINAGSVMGVNGFLKKYFCSYLLKSHKVHFVASDTHNITSRPPRLNDCYKKISRKYGINYANNLFINNQKLIIENETL